MDQVDAVVVGAGVAGLAVARQLALAGREVLILEAAARFGTGASARNSEVIHAGIYYPPGSLKARLCVRGRERLYEFCAGRAIPHRRCEKLIVATTDAELPGLARVAATAQIPAAYFVKGSYFALKGRAPFERLIYPLPDAGGLGIHLTLDLGSRARFGPDVEWVDSCDYRVDARRAPAFYAAIRRYWPALPDGALEPAYAGVRPQSSGPGEPLADFPIDEVRTQSVPGLINLLGIESPGLTASHAIA